MTQPLILIAALILVALAGMALFNFRAARLAELANPPVGKFIDVNGCRLHYAEKGEGDVVVLLHGSGSMLQDFTASGLFDLAARRFRVIAFDRPGYGYSTRPRRTIWTADAQAELIHAALAGLNVRQAIVFAHSWGPLVAISLARKHPEAVRGLVLASGFYYPRWDLEIVLHWLVSIPLAGRVLRWTIAPLLGRLAWRREVARNFDPRPVPDAFAAFPKEMALRPAHIGTMVMETRLLLPAASALTLEYGKLSMPVAIMTGESDRICDAQTHSLQLHRDVPHSKLIPLPGEGHMIHYTATGAVMDAIELVGK
jgi:pimeloyl-ACP methyl ester carboxylesterase